MWCWFSQGVWENELFDKDGAKQREGGEEGKDDEAGVSVKNFWGFSEYTKGAKEA